MYPRTSHRWMSRDRPGRPQPDQREESDSGSSEALSRRSPPPSAGLRLLCRGFGLSRPTLMFPKQGVAIGRFCACWPVAPSFVPAGSKSLAPKASTRRQRRCRGCALARNSGCGRTGVVLNASRSPTAASTQPSLKRRNSRRARLLSGRYSDRAEFSELARLTRLMHDARNRQAAVIPDCSAGRGGGGLRGSSRGLLGAHRVDDARTLSGSHRRAPASRPHPAGSG